MTRPDTIADNERRTVEHFATTDMSVAELERALDHVWSGGMGSAEFPWLPMFEAFQTETIEC